METKKLRDLDDLERIRLELDAAKRYADSTVQVLCHDRAEAEALQGKLSEEERANVRFSWVKRP